MLIHHRTEGQPMASGIELFHYYNDEHISGIFIVVHNVRCGIRWNRPNHLKPLIACQHLQ